MRSRLPALILLALLLAPARPASTAPLDGRDVHDDIFYQIMPISWRDSDNDAQRFGDFGGMTASLPYLRSLGVTAMWMTPVFTSPAYHGYQHMPPNVVNPWFGTESQLLSFVGTAHSDSVKVFLDLVAYGVSQNSTYFTSSYGNPSSPYASYLGYTNAGDTAYDGGTYTTWNGGTVGFIKWNLANPTVTGLEDGWCQHWLDPNGDGNPADGIDGFRLDHVVDDEGWGYTTAWWSQWKTAMQAKNPSVFTFAEQGDWGSHGTEFMGPHDATFTIPFMFAARSEIASETAAGLYTEMAATVAALPAGHTYIGIVGNHDVDRLASNTGNVPGRSKVAAAILMTQPYPPCIYYGDELGMRGTKGNWGTDANDIPNREPMKWNAVAGAPMSNYYVLSSQAYSARFEQDNDGRSVPEETGVSGSLLETYRSLIALRKAHAALRRGDYGAIANSSPAVWSFSRYAASQETLLVAINLSGTAVTPNLDLSSYAVTGGSSPVRDVISGASLAALTTTNSAAYAVTIPAYGWRVLSAQVTPGPGPAASTIDGRAIPGDFGPSALVATQALPTSMGDNTGELDQMYLKPRTDGLAIGITGNVPTDGTALAIFFDTVAGGQDSLATSAFGEPPNGVPEMTGLGFDTGFTPDRLLWANGYGGTLYVDLFTLDTAGGGTHRYLGSTPANSGLSALSGGSNTFGTQAALDDSNTAGVTAASAAAAGTATQGFEALVPWGDLGLPGYGAPVKVMAALVRPTGAFGNQFLPPLATGTPDLGLPPVSLKAVAGLQYVTQATTLAVPPAQPVRGLRMVAGPNPLRDTTTLRFGLAHASRVTCEVLDVGGRRVRTLGTRLLDAGEQSVRWDGRDDAGRAVGAGLYFVRVRGENVTGVARLAVVR